MGTRLSEKCVLQRHFLGYVTAEEEGGEAEIGDNHRNPYLMRQLMGFCMFHGCKEVKLIGEAEPLHRHGVSERVVGGANVTLFA